MPQYNAQFFSGNGELTSHSFFSIQVQPTLLWSGQEDSKLYCSFKFRWVSGIVNLIIVFSIKFLFKYLLVLMLLISFMYYRIFSFWSPMCFFRLHWGCFYISTKVTVLSNGQIVKSIPLLHLRDFCNHSSPLFSSPEVLNGLCLQFYHTVT